MHCCTTLWHAPLVPIAGQSKQRRYYILYCPVCTPVGSDGDGQAILHTVLPCLYPVDSNKLGAPLHRGPGPLHPGQATPLGAGGGLLAYVSQLPNGLLAALKGQTPRLGSGGPVTPGRAFSGCPGLTRRATVVSSSQSTTADCAKRYILSLTRHPNPRG